MQAAFGKSTVILLIAKRWAPRENRHSHSKVTILLLTRTRKQRYSLALLLIVTLSHFALAH